MKILIQLIILFSACFYTYSYSQPNKRTNYWYFYSYCGLSFNTGEPQVILDGMIANSIGGDPLSGCTVMSDANGNLLFYTDGQTIYRKDHLIMAEPYPGGYPGTQASVIIPKPGSDHIYYAFFVDLWYHSNQGPLRPLHYATIDMDQNSGFGAVTDVDTVLTLWGMFAADKLTAVYQSNKYDIWVIVRKYNSPSVLAVIPITENGVQIDGAVISPAPDPQEPDDRNSPGYMKVSYDKKYLISVFEEHHLQPMDIEICTFDDETGEIDFLYTFNLREITPSYNKPFLVSSIEFSPDSKLLYVTGFVMQDSTCYIFQFDMSTILDSASFVTSWEMVGTGQGRSAQLASDGKIYFSSESFSENDYMGVIHKPWLRGPACDYENNAIYMEGRKVGRCLPNFMTDYLLRFDFEGQCALDTFYFDPWFFPEPTWIQWNFGDTASGSQNISYDLRPKHVFSHGGEYEVSVLLTYPSGRVEKTSRVVEVDSIPYPDLGPDTLICRGSSVTLDAGCNAQFFTWSTGQWGVSSITVSDS
ncbi:MAG: PKD domain-containing protein, partial [Bacteroidales bacterium]|nr:PKD domain-containing protein [Bacteroidales bacterium]